ncbi:hypothetical protein NL676_004974 [Syzygium grande]|nr:hypothetical protein NL676_004974 [Syzygium grande]
MTDVNRLTGSLHQRRVKRLDYPPSRAPCTHQAGWPPQPSAFIRTRQVAFHDRSVPLRDCCESTQVPRSMASWINPRQASGAFCRSVPATFLVKLHQAAQEPLQIAFTTIDINWRPAGDPARSGRGRRSACLVRVSSPSSAGLRRQDRAFTLNGDAGTGAAGRLRAWHWQA